MRKFNPGIIILLGFVLTACNTPSEPVSEHRFDGTYKYDAICHWEACLDHGCYYQKNKASHEYGDPITKEATCEEDGYIKYKCKTCDYFKITTIDHEGHTYDYGSYSFNTTHHWNECSKCHLEKYKEEHTFTAWEEISAPTETKEGLKLRKCNECGYEQTEHIPVTVHNYDENVWNYNATYHWHDCLHCDEHILQAAHIESDWIVDKDPTSSSTGKKHKECTICKYVLEEETIPCLTTETVNLYAINDFHGEVDKISKVMGYLKERKAEPNTLVLNSGDTYQGSLISNSNYGQLLTNCMNVVGFDEITVGNHDFDWGLDPLGEIIDTANMPYLGANVYHYDFDKGTWGDFASEYFEKYTIKTLDNGLKVGIIGVIGAQQITSICTQYVKTIGFKNPVPIVQTLAQELKKDKGCDIVVVSAHCDASGVSGLTKNDVDAVFLGHTHQATTDIVDGLPFIQGGQYGSHVSNITLTCDKATKTVTCDNNTNIAYSKTWPNEPTCDNLIAEERKIRDVEASEVLATNVPYLSTASGANFIANAMSYMAYKQNYDIDLAITNSARNTFSGGTLTYEKLYNIAPFDNVVYIAQVTGYDLINEINSGGYIYRVNPNAFVSSNYVTYTVAIIDYLLLHCNSSRKYNYFSHGFTILGQLTKADYTLYNYRFICRDTLRAETVDFSAYTSKTNRNDKSCIKDDVSFN